jgi:hypothetical protein
MDDKSLAIQLVALIDDLSPNRFSFDHDLPPLLEKWRELKPGLIAAGADPSRSGSNQARNLRAASQALVDCIAPAAGGKHVPFADLEDILHDFPRLHDQAASAADDYLKMTTRHE